MNLLVFIILGIVVEAKLINAASCMYRWRGWGPQWSEDQECLRKLNNPETTPEPETNEIAPEPETNSKPETITTARPYSYLKDCIFRWRGWAPQWEEDLKGCYNITYNNTHSEFLKKMIKAEDKIKNEGFPGVVEEAVEGGKDVAGFFSSVWKDWEKIIHYGLIILGLLLVVIILFALLYLCHYFRGFMKIIKRHEPTPVDVV